MNAVPRTPWTDVAVFAGAGVAVALHVGQAPGAIPLLRADLGLGLTAAGWVMSIFNLVAAGAGVAIGLVADRYGQARVALAGMLLVALASAVGAAAPNAFVLLASRAVEGVGFILTAVSVPSLITQAAAPADRRVALGLWGANVPHGIGAMLLLGGAGWRGVWLLAAALTLAAALAPWLVTRGTPPLARPEKASLAAPLRELAARCGPWVLGRDLRLVRRPVSRRGRLPAADPGRGRRRGGAERARRARQRARQRRRRLRSARRRAAALATVDGRDAAAAVTTAAALGAIALARLLDPR